MSGAAGEADLIRVVLADANVLYSRVLRDYLLYAADQEIVAIAWSSQILAEVTEHLMENVEGFDHAAAQRLVGAMNRAFPYAEVKPDEEHWRMLQEVSLPDEDDRHVLAASLAAEATVLCTSNTPPGAGLVRGEAAGREPAQRSRRSRVPCPLTAQGRPGSHTGDISS
jgi:predicted nucleic acid-binding protein